MKYGLIAGSGRFPLLALESARQLGHEMVAVGIKGEASPEIEKLAPRAHWISIGQLGKLIDILHSEGISEIFLAGQVKHVSIFSNVRPDWRLLKLLATLPRKNTDSLIGALQRALEEEGIRFSDSTALLKPLLADEGVITKRKPNKDETANIDYGRPIANTLAGYDVGQSIAVCERACVALEAMEGTDQMLLRAASLVNGRPITLVKVARRRRHMLFDVPVLGLETVNVMRETHTTAVAVDANSTLLLDRGDLVEQANAAKIAIIGIKGRSS
ncbi:MAG: UDP-2,3-diacylglucosamine diphosphatase LpxI [Bryobacteraceae bacterium]